MLELFRSNLYINSILLFPYIVLVRIYSLIYPVSYEFSNEKCSFFVHLVLGGFSHPLLQNIVAVILIFIQASLLNYILSRHKISRETTLFAGVVYVLLVSLIPDNNGLSPILIANTFLILAVANLFDCYKQSEAGAFIFNSGFFLGIASVFYTPYFVFIIFGLIALILVRSFRVMEKLRYLSGVLVPYYFMLTYFYIKDIEFAKLELLKGIFFSIPKTILSGNIIDYLSVGLLFLIILFVLYNYNYYISRKNIQAHKKIDISYWLLIFCLISFLLFRTEGKYHLLSLSIPLALLVSINLSESKRKVTYEILHICVLILIGVSGFI
ncbi:MAG: hypothetical protein IPM42_08395 [Saprospiraceae bacterium]|nr:hypothetical protein [Saprospiraceae bacterium]